MKLFNSRVVLNPITSVSFPRLHILLTDTTSYSSGWYEQPIAHKYTVCLWFSLSVMCVANSINYSLLFCDKLSLFSLEEPFFPPTNDTLMVVVQVGRVSCWRQDFWLFSSVRCGLCPRSPAAVPPPSSASGPSDGSLFASCWELWVKHSSQIHARACCISRTTGGKKQSATALTGNKNSNEIIFGYFFLHRNSPSGCLTCQTQSNRIDWNWLRTCLGPPAPWLTHFLSGEPEQTLLIFLSRRKQIL